MALSSVTDPLVTISGGLERLDAEFVSPRSIIATKFRLEGGIQDANCCRDPTLPPSCTLEDMQNDISRLGVSVVVVENTGDFINLLPRQPLSLH